MEESFVNKCPSWARSLPGSLWWHGWLLSSPLACFWAYAYVPDGCTSWKSDLWEIRGFFLIMKIVMLVEHYGRITQQRRPSPHPQVQLVKGRDPSLLQGLAEHVTISIGRCGTWYPNPSVHLCQKQAHVPQNPEPFPH